MGFLPENIEISMGESEGSYRACDIRKKMESVCGMLCFVIYLSLAAAAQWTCKQIHWACCPRERDAGKRRKLALICL